MDMSAKATGDPVPLTLDDVASSKACLLLDVQDDSSELTLTSNIAVLQFLLILLAFFLLV